MKQASGIFYRRKLSVIFVLLGIFLACATIQVLILIGPVTIQSLLIVSIFASVSLLLFLLSYFYYHQNVKVTFFINENKPFVSFGNSSKSNRVTSCKLKVVHAFPVRIYDRELRILHQLRFSTLERDYVMTENYSGGIYSDDKIVLTDKYYVEDFHSRGSSILEEMANLIESALPKHSD